MAITIPATAAPAATAMRVVWEWLVMPAAAPASGGDDVPAVADRAVKGSAALG